MNEFARLNAKDSCGRAPYKHVPMKEAHLFEALRRICAIRDVTQLVMRLKEIVPEYNPSAHVLRQALAERHTREDRRATAVTAGD